MGKNGAWGYVTDYNASGYPEKYSERCVSEVRAQPLHGKRWEARTLKDWQFRPAHVLLQSIWEKRRNKAHIWLWSKEFHHIHLLYFLYLFYLLQKRYGEWNQYFSMVPIPLSHVLQLLEPPFLCTLPEAYNILQPPLHCSSTFNVIHMGIFKGWLGLPSGYLT